MCEILLKSVNNFLINAVGRWKDNHTSKNITFLAEGWHEVWCIADIL